MTMIRANFGPRVMRFTPIIYCTDVRRDDGPKIPLGVMADIQIGSLYGLGLVSRECLTDEEASLVGGLVREVVRRPFDLLQTEFDRVWEADQQVAAFERLPVEHFNALSFGNLDQSDVIAPPKLFMLNEETADAAEQFAKDQLELRLIERYWALMTEHWGNDLADRKVKSSVRPAVAA